MNPLRRGGRPFVIEFFGRQGTASLHVRHATAVAAVGVVAAHQVCHSQSHASCSGGPRSRRRPPVFGPTVPRITTRGMVTTRRGDTTPLLDGGELEQDDHDDHDDCPMCRKFSKGPCGHLFKKWMACTDSHRGKDAQGEPIHLKQCESEAKGLAECLDRNEDYYTSNAWEDPPTDTSKLNVDQWRSFVKKMEAGIENNKYTLTDFPSDTLPRVQISRSESVAVFFRPEDVKCQTIIAAYILDEQGDVIAAGSKHDIQLDALGCVLQFKTNDLKAVTIRAIYDSDDKDSVTVYTMKAKLS